MFPRIYPRVIVTITTLYLIKRSATIYDGIYDRFEIFWWGINRVSLCVHRNRVNSVIIQSN